LGFLAGTTAENEKITNIGLYDQRAALQWVQDYISLVGGDPENVSAWGESAGAGSIMHHLIAFRGKQKPLFKQAVIQSPFLEPRFDRAGYLEEQFKTFEKGAGCEGKGIKCLREVKVDSLSKGATAVFNWSPNGTFGFG
jgi:carboxylesterase type B